MKKIRNKIGCLAIALLVVLPLPMKAGRNDKVGLVVGSCNFRCLSEKDVANGNGWSVRYPWLCDFIEFVFPDLLGTQEATYSQKIDVLAALPEYDCIGVGRNDGKSKGEHALIFFKKERFVLLKQGNFWLSETPEKPSKGWDAAHPRICTWGCFRDKVSHKKLWMFNLHNDHKGVTARRESAKLVISKISEMTTKGDLVLLTGDFNVDQNNEIYTIYSQFLEDSFETAERRYAPNGTTNAFMTESFTNSRIDHVFVSPGVRVFRYGVFTETYRTASEKSDTILKSPLTPSEIDFHPYTARTLSDHFPVFVKIFF